MSPKKTPSTGTPNSILDEVPPEYRERWTELVELTDQFCDRYLDDDYKQVCRKMAACLCQQNSPVLKGKVASWACGIAYCVGKVNFLTDPSQTPHLKSEEVAKGFGVSPATMYNKSKDLWDGLDLHRFDPDFTVAAMVEQNPYIWILTVNGMMMDIRTAPREAQVMTYEQGLIPYIPADRTD